MSAVLEAKDAIRELMAAYAMALDACRFADVGACFAPDGEWTTDYGAARGPAEIEKFIRGIVPVKGEGPQRKHYITNIIIKVDGDTASAVSDYLIVRESENGLIPVMGGTYRGPVREDARRLALRAQGARAPHLGRHGAQERALV